VQAGTPATGLRDDIAAITGVETIMWESGPPATSLLALL